ncbi:hypothetical protein SAZ11_35465 [Streptomyces sp. FXJ1.4098]|nr:hypothetical protein [Streptomyces sp. FXJ1.4098]
MEELAVAVPRIFGMAFGLAGLGGTWVTAGQAGHVPVIVGRALMGLTAVVWLVSVGWYLRYVCGGRGRLRADLEDPVASPFASLALIVPMLLAAQGLAPYSLTAGRVLVDVFLVLTVLFGGWLTGQWICRPMELDQMHPGYYLPTVAGGLVACASAAKVGQTRLAEVMFGFGVICWFILGSMIGGRLFHRPRLPAPLLPTMAIEVAPAAIASVAYFALDQGRVDFIAAALAGYGLLMVIVQLRLVPSTRACGSRSARGPSPSPGPWWPPPRCTGSMPASRRATSSTSTSSSRPSPSSSVASRPGPSWPWPVANCLRPRRPPPAPTALEHLRPSTVETRLPIDPDRPTGRKGWVQGLALWDA